MEAGKRGSNGHTNDAFRCSLASTNSWSSVFKVVDNAQSRLVKVATCLSQWNRTRGAVNKFRAELIFKSGDLLADGRLTNSTFLCDSGEAPFFNDSDEHLHCVEFVHTSLPIPLRNGFYARNRGYKPKEGFLPAPYIPIGNSWYSLECWTCCDTGTSKG